MKHHALLLTPLLFALPAFAKPSDGYAISTNNACKVYYPPDLSYRQVKWQGDCQDGYAEGYGVATWGCQQNKNCGYAVTGTYVRGKLHGRATAQALHPSLETQTLEADYQNNITTGYQKIIFDNGDIYEGEPQSNTNIHRGKYTFGKGEFLGDRYEGEWQNAEAQARANISLPMAIIMKAILLIIQCMAKARSIMPMA